MAANSASSLGEIMQLLTDQSRAMIGAHQAVTSFTADKNWSQAITGLSLSDKYSKYRTYDAKPDGSGIYAWVCEINRPVRMTQAELESHPRWRGFGAEAGSHPSMRGWLAAPLISRHGENLGLIQLSDKVDGEFTAEDEALLVQVAQLGSVAIEVRNFQNELEGRVAARTAELVEVNQTLRAEIAERKRVEEELRQKSEELEQFNRLAVGREERMIELKRQINELARQAGQEIPYNLSFADVATSTT
jgi:GAF domain-containing protein